MKKYSQKQRVVENFFIYSLTALASSLILSSPFWFPSMKAFLFVSLPKVGFVLLSPKVLFIVGNLIVVVLVGESKFFAPKSSPASNVYYDEYISRSRRTTLQNSSIFEENKKERQVEKCFEENVKKICEDGEEKIELEKEGDDEVSFSAEELSKRADDFIARVNRKRRLEATLLCCSK
ncbi:hypothetical protein Dsin_030462 [Dipteronia sinensis]|uniref:DUF4408 domain-containing protein n=1 Tax=Dipteronia sinensis TaxID=43782 RepID=A0AAD9ZJH7_9ROSI|nr:hypothetical protein Dsin_030462 [Dipteronia sinensis]